MNDGGVNVHKDPIWKTKLVQKLTDQIDANEDLLKLLHDNEIG